MGAYLADALRRRLARQEADGDAEGAKATKKRLQAVEKAEPATVVEDEPKATPSGVATVVEDAPKPKTAAKEK
jgi:hypothetical protein